jgi:hypothetical protein
MRCSESHPDEMHDPAQIFRQVSDETLSQEIITAANALIDAKITQLKFAPISIQMDPGTRPLLFHRNHDAGDRAITHERSHHRWNYGR